MSAPRRSEGRSTSSVNLDPRVLDLLDSASASANMAMANYAAAVIAGAILTGSADRLASVGIDRLGLVAKAKPEQRLRWEIEAPERTGGGVAASIHRLDGWTLSFNGDPNGWRRREKDPTYGWWLDGPGLAAPIHLDGGRDTARKAAEGYVRRWRALEEQTRPAAPVDAPEPAAAPGEPQSIDLDFPTAWRSEPRLG